MRSIRKSLLQFIFSGADMRRWNDKLRHTELFELDKQAHKMIVAFLLWQQNTKDLPPDEQRRISAPENTNWRRLFLMLRMALISLA